MTETTKLGLALFLWWLLLVLVSCDAHGQAVDRQNLDLYSPLQGDVGKSEVENGRLKSIMVYTGGGWTRFVPATEPETTKPQDFRGLDGSAVSRSVPYIPSPLRATSFTVRGVPAITNDPPLGILTTLLSTNRMAPSFEPEACPTCGRVLYKVIEQFNIVSSNVVPARLYGKIVYLPVDQPKTNSVGIYTTNWIDNPALYQMPYMRAMPMPPLPPDPQTLYLQHRSRMVPGVVPP